MNLELVNTETSNFIKENLKEDVSRLILNGSPFEHISIQELAQQFVGYQKSQNKLPTWFETDGIYFPPKLNIEQTSSETTAAYKASLFSGNRFIDLTGGFGVDDYYLSQNFKHGIHCELNEELAAISKYNYQKLDVTTLDIHLGDSIEFLKNTEESFDLIYVDPSRRTESKGRVFMLKDCEPNIPEILNLLFSKSDTILIKTSPLLDITAGLKELTNVAEIHCVAVKNEVKELLWILKKELTIAPLKFIAVNLESNFSEPVILNSRLLQESESHYDEPKTYLYEPNAALMKLGAFNWIGTHYELDKLAPNSHLYTSEELIEFPGRIFKIDQVIPYSKKEITKIIKNQKAHITTRNFKESVNTLRTKFKVKDGGDTYLFFTTLENAKAVMISCTKI